MTWMICRYPHFRKPAITYSRSPALLSCLHRLWSDNLSRQLGAVAQPNGRRSKNQHHKTSNNCAFNHFHHICIHVCWYLLHGHFNYPNPSHSFKINQNHWKILKVSFIDLLTSPFRQDSHIFPFSKPCRRDVMSHKLLTSLRLQCLQLKETDWPHGTASASCFSFLRIVSSWMVGS